jgi:predicted nucleotidyltransferase component of viral defense system
VLSADDARTVGAAFGVARLQVERDHLISHCLIAIANVTRDLDHPPVFFGGTALARTWLPDGRLSEDIDL